MNQLLSFVKTFLQDSKAVNIVDFCISDMSDVTDYVVIATGSSSQQVKSLAENLMTQCKLSNIEILGHEGTDWWVLVDLGEVVVHIMQKDAREYYQLERLWQINED